MKARPYPKFLAMITASFMFIQAVQSQGVPPHLQADYNRVRMQHSTMHNYTNYNYNIWGRLLNLNSNKIANNRYDFTVILKDSTARFVNSKIHVDTALNKAYLLLVNKKLPKFDPNREERLYCDQTIRIFRVDVNNYRKIEGFANDSCWLFKVVTGKINAYSGLSEVNTIDSRYLSAFQVDGGSVQPITRESLLKVIIENTKATIAFYDGDYLAAIRRFNQDVEKSLKKQQKQEAGSNSIP